MAFRPMHFSIDSIVFTNGAKPNFLGFPYDFLMPLEYHLPRGAANVKGT